MYYVVPEETHNQLVQEAFRARGFEPDETAHTVRICAEAARHGIRSHNALKALHLDTLFGSPHGGCVPGAQIKKPHTRFAAVRGWDAQRKIGPAIAYPAIEEGMRLADQYGVGIISVDNAFHYFWGGGYVLEAAKHGYIAYTQCTALLAEVVPYLGKTPTLGTNPHSWALPTSNAIGYPILVDWATSNLSMGRIQECKREGKPLPPSSAVDRQGEPTLDPDAAVGLLPFGAHKGYGLGLINEVLAAFIGGSLPTHRGRPEYTHEKNSASFLFLVIHPDAIALDSYANGHDRDANLASVLNDIRGHGNESAIFPGQNEAKNARLTDKAGGLLFTASELDAFVTIAREADQSPWDRAQLQRFDPSD